jgi:hypothetical protein
MNQSEREVAERIRLCIWTLGQLKARGMLEEIANDYDIRWLETIDTDDTDLADENDSDE